MKKLRNTIIERYPRQIRRVRLQGNSTMQIEQTVDQAINNLSEGSRSFVIYGEPQSGKTEMMICLTSKLLDLGHKTIVVLVNDSIDLLNQNLSRFQLSGISPTPRSLGELKNSELEITSAEVIIFCKKNSKDLRALISRLDSGNEILVIDDEADYATPNAKINVPDRNVINELVEELINLNGLGTYIAVTATPARLDLNNTLCNDRKYWIYFSPHELYCGYNVFFPPISQGLVPFKITLLPELVQSPENLENALLNFIVNVAAINHEASDLEEVNFSFLVHTSGRKIKHSDDKLVVEKFFASLEDENNSECVAKLNIMHTLAIEKYGKEKADSILEYIFAKRTSYSIRVINCDTDKQLDTVNAATNPRSTFTVAIGGNIISRGVTFNNLLGMYFTRSPKTTIQQDTYIQRARMFGNRLPYLEYFELHIPESLYQDWHRAFTFHHLALQSIKSGQPVWIEDSRVKAVSRSSIDRVNVSIDTGELRFGLFDYSPEIAALSSSTKVGMHHLDELVHKIGVDYLPSYIRSFIAALSEYSPESVVLHKSSLIYDRKDVDADDIYRKRGGLIGGTERESGRFPDAIHHFKIFYNKSGKARLIYLHKDGKLNIRYIKWERKELANVS